MDSHLVLLTLAVIFIVSPVILGLSHIQNKYVLSVFSSGEYNTVHLAIVNGLLIVAGLLFREIQNRDTRFLNQELAKQIKTTVQNIKQK